MRQGADPTVQEIEIPHLNITLKCGDVISITKDRAFNSMAVPALYGYTISKFDVIRIYKCQDKNTDQCRRCETMAYITNHEHNFGGLACLSREVKELKILSRVIEEINKCVVV